MEHAIRSLRTNTSTTQHSTGQHNRTACRGIVPGAACPACRTWEGGRLGVGGHHQQVWELGRQGGDRHAGAPPGLGRAAQQAGQAPSERRAGLG